MAGKGHGRPGLGLLAGLAVLCGGGGAVAGCRNDFITAVSSEGAHISTGQGGVFQVLPQVLVTPTEWQPGQQVSICSYQTVPNYQLFAMINMARSESLVVALPSGGKSAAVGARRRKK